MRKVSSDLYITLDGVTESPNAWLFDAFDEGLGVATGEGLTDVDTLMLGRATHEAWAS